MPKLTLDVNAIKALASETRLNVLRVLDGKKMSLKDISKVKDTAHQIKNVKDLQEALKTLGYDPGTIDGIVGPKTMQAVRKFQREQQLAVDGVAGPQTKGRMITLLKAIKKG